MEYPTSSKANRDWNVVEKQVEKGFDPEDT